MAPRGALARTNGGYRLLIFGVIPLGSALGGVIGQLWGSRAGVAVGAVGLALSAVPMVRRPIRSLRDPQDAKEHSEQVADSSSTAAARCAQQESNPRPGA